MIVLLGFAIAGVVLLVVPTLLYLLGRRLWRRRRYGRLLFTISFTAVCAWLIYDAIYPPPSFYTAELQRLVNVSLPAEAKFIYKTATYPDIHGDYSACFIVHLSPTAMEQLKASIASEPAHESKSAGCGNMDKTLKPLNAMASQYTLTKRATREDAEIFIELISASNLAVISWYTW